jgi:hypothetical protein
MRGVRTTGGLSRGRGSEPAWHLRMNHVMNQVVRPRRKTLANTHQTEGVPGQGPVHTIVASLGCQCFHGLAGAASVPVVQVRCPCQVERGPGRGSAAGSPALEHSRTSITASRTLAWQTSPPALAPGRDGRLSTAETSGPGFIPAPSPRIALLHYGCVQVERLEHHFK